MKSYACSFPDGIDQVLLVAVLDKVEERINKSSNPQLELENLWYLVNIPELPAETVLSKPQLGNELSTLLKEATDYIIAHPPGEHEYENKMAHMSLVNKLQGK